MEESEKNFEQFPTKGVDEENIKRAEEFEEVMSGVQEFPGDAFGNYVGSEETDDSDKESVNNEGIIDAAAIVNRYVDAASRNQGVETVVQLIKTFDYKGEGNPMQALMKHLGIDTAKEQSDLEKDAAAERVDTELMDGVQRPAQAETATGVLAAINNMKELISEVEGADERYAGLRKGAREMGIGIFEYTSKQYNAQNLSGVLQVLAEQREQSAEREEVAETKEESEEEGAEGGGIEGRDEEGENIIPFSGGDGKDGVAGIRDGDKDGEQINPEILRRAA